MNIPTTRFAMPNNYAKRRKICKAHMSSDLLSICRKYVLSRSEMPRSSHYPPPLSRNSLKRVPSPNSRGRAKAVRGSSGRARPLALRLDMR